MIAREIERESQPKLRLAKLMNPSNLERGLQWLTLPPFHATLTYTYITNYRKIVFIIITKTRIKFNCQHCLKNIEYKKIEIAKQIYVIMETFDSWYIVIFSWFKNRVNLPNTDLTKLEGGNWTLVLLCMELLLVKVKRSFYYGRGLRDCASFGVDFH